MAEFLDIEAVLDSDSEIVDSDTETIVRSKKKKKKQKKRRIHEDDDEMELEDSEALAEELKDFIVKDDELDEDEEGNEEQEKECEEVIARIKRKRQVDADDEDLDECLELIKENTGLEIKRKHKRIRLINDDSDNEEVDQKTAIEKSLFDQHDDDDVDMSEDGIVTTNDTADKDEFGNLESEEESDIDDFIVDDQGRPNKRKKTQKDRQLEEARDIFGNGFDDEVKGQTDDEEWNVNEEYEEAEETHFTQTKKRVESATKKSIFDLFEPSELQRGHYTEFDKKIKLADVPERFKMRQISVTPTVEGELEEEAKWIYKHAFATPTISVQPYLDQHQRVNDSSLSEIKVVSKIKNAINFMRNQLLEVPFIAFYRKEFVEPELNITDLWKVWQWDEKWMRLITRKRNLIHLFTKMQNFLSEQNTENESDTETMIELSRKRLENMETMEQLQDAHQHFELYYGHDASTMRTVEKQKAVEQAAQNGEEQEKVVTKHTSRCNNYTICLGAKLDEICNQFGLKPSEFGENMRDNYQRHNVQQCIVEPLELARNYICPQFPTEEDVLKGCHYMIATQISHDPLVRQCVRQTYFERAKLRVQPTAKGIKTIEEGHSCYTMTFLKNKPVKDLKNDQFLKLVLAETDGLLKISMFIDEEVTSVNSMTYFEEVRPLYQRDEFSDLAQQWNVQRVKVVKKALEEMLYPEMEMELRSKLIAEAKQGILKACSERLFDWLRVGPYQADRQFEEDYNEDDYDSGVRVLGIAYSQERDTATFGALIDGNGIVEDYVRLAHFTCRHNSFKQTERNWKEKDMKILKKFILHKRPHVIAVTAECRDTFRIVEDIKSIISDLEREEHIAPINVELVDNQVALIAEMSEEEFKEYPPILKHAVSIARRIQDPLVEFAQLCNADEGILCLNYHPMQNEVSAEELLKCLHLEFINRVNEVGVDINQCIKFPHKSYQLQFVCGLGPSKANYLLRILKQKVHCMENRSQLIQECKMGPKVFINCSGFIKVDTSSLMNRSDDYIEVLDGSRVHPESYELARTMAVSALYDDTEDVVDPTSAMEEILDSPEKLKDLDLNDYAEQLESKGFGDKHITLYDIRAEFKQCYKDLRMPYRAPTKEEMFNMLTKETPETFYVGMMVMCRVTGFANRRPNQDEVDKANPVCVQETGLWRCPLCHKDNFRTSHEVSRHLDGNHCLGSTIGVRTQLDNGVSGFIHVKNISDKEVANPKARIQPGTMINARITRINIDRFQVDLTSKSSDLVDKYEYLRPKKDMYYDYDSEMTLMEKKEEEKKKQEARPVYLKRNITHPNFKNIDFASCEKEMASMDVGDVIFRPSSKASNHLTLTWKVTEGVLQHIDILEENKDRFQSLGKNLIIGDEEYGDLDEIMARLIQPMAGFARDVIRHRYYKDVKGNPKVLRNLLLEEKKKTPSRIPYYFSSCHKYPGYFLLSYMPRREARNEYFKAMPEGLKFRNTIFSSLSRMIEWFKKHFNDPIPGMPTTARNPIPPAATSTPNLELQASTPGQTPSQQMFGSMPQAAAVPSQGFPASYGANMYPGFQVPVTSPMTTQAYSAANGYMGGSTAMPVLQPPPPPPILLGATPYYPTAHTPATGSTALPKGIPTYMPTSKGRTPSHTPQTKASRAVSKQPSVNSSTLGTDWAKAAELWAKQRQSKIPMV